MKKKVIIISPNLFTKRDYHRFGAEYLESSGYEVELWQVIFGTPVDFDYGEWGYSGNNYYKLNKNDFMRRVATNREAVYIVQGGCYTFTYWGLCKYSCKFIIVHGLQGVIRHPSDSISVPLLKRIIIRLIKKEVRLKDYFSYTRKLCENKLIKFRCKISGNSPMAIITSTRHIASVYFPKDVLKDVLYVHSGDYDAYIETQRIDSKQREKHIVYCDSGFAENDYHAAVAGNKIESEIYSVYLHREEYYRQMEKLFRKLEEYYGVPVVISGHPHVVYDEKSFSGREIIRGKTCELVRDAKLFITTCSNSMNFAILYDKPILFAQNEDFKKHVFPGAENVYSYIEYIAEEKLQIGFINMSNHEEMERPWEKCKKLPRREREEFLRDYIIDTDKTDKTIIEYIEEMLREL